MKKFAEFVFAFRWLLITITILITSLCVYYLKDGIRINSDVISNLPDDDPAAVLYKEIGKEFKGSSLGMIALETDNVLNTEVLKDIALITDSLRYNKNISFVTSLTNSIDIKGNEWGIEIGKLINDYEIPENDKDIDSLTKRIFSKEMYKGSIISNDTTVALIIFTLQDDVDKEKVSREIKQMILSLNLTENIYFAGLPFMLNDISDLILSDIIRLIPFSLAMILLVFAVSFRTFRGTILPAVSAGIAILWTISAMKLLGFELSMITNTIPILLLAIGSAYSIHVLNRFENEKNAKIKERIVDSLAYITLPVLLAALTTIVGFLSFVFGSYLVMIREFGIFTALGVFFSLLISLTFVPAVIAVMSRKNTKQKDITEINRNGLFEKLVVQPLFWFVSKQANWVLIIWLAVVICSLWGIFMINRNVSMIDYFKKDNPTRISENLMQEKLGGSQVVYVQFEGNIQSPEVLNKMKKCQDFMKKNPHIGHTQSVADLIEEMNDVMGEGKKIPEEEAKIQQLWFLLDGQDIMEQLVNYDLTKGLIQSRFTSINYVDMNDFVNQMNNFIKQNSTENCRICLTGMPSIYVNMDHSLLRSQFSSLLLAIIFVLIVVAGLLRSLKYGFLATLPIIVTILILFGFMGFAGISLDLATVLVASVVLGIGIDYSIHVLTHYRHVFSQTKDSYSAIENMFRISGRAILINVLSVSAGLMVLLFSEMVPLRHFGLLILLSMVGSGFGALTIISSIIIKSQKKKNFNS